MATFSAPSRQHKSHYSVEQPGGPVPAAGGCCTCTSRIDPKSPSPLLSWPSLLNTKMAEFALQTAAAQFRCIFTI